jgi:hypothetical protein
VEEQMSSILGKLEVAAEQIAQTLVDAAPEAYAFALNVTRWESIGYLVVGVACAVLAYWGFRWAQHLIYNSGSYDLEELGGFGVGTVAFGLACASAINLLYIWNWIGAFAPELRLARQILGKFV